MLVYNTLNHIRPFVSSKSTLAQIKQKIEWSRVLFFFRNHQLKHKLYTCSFSPIEIMLAITRYHIREVKGAKKKGNFAVETNRQKCYMYLVHIQRWTIYERKSMWKLLLPKRFSSSVHNLNSECMMPTNSATLFLFIFMFSFQSFVF